MNTSPIHVCIVTTAHPIDDVRVNSKFALAFRQAGFRVSWVGPGHAFFDTAKYVRDGIEFLLAPPNRTRFDRVRSAARIRRLVPCIAGVDVYYCPEPDSAYLAVKLAKRNGAKVIVDIHEIYHGALLDRWLFGWRFEVVRKYVRRRIARICASCDLVAGVSASVLDPYFTNLSRRLIIRSCAPAWFGAGDTADVCGVGRPRFTLMHGKGAMERGTAFVLDALQIAAHEVSGISAVMFVAEEPASCAEGLRLAMMARVRSIEGNLDLRKRIPMRDMPDVLRTCDVGLIAYGRNLGVDSLPNRLFEYMSVGLPIVAPRYATEIAKIIESEKCGLLADFEDPKSIAAAIVQLRRDPALCREMGRRAREAFLARHNWEVEVRPLLARIHGWFPDRRVA
jgi:glycosyltransferase involved in cell wall biosynthesis